MAKDFDPGENCEFARSVGILDGTSQADLKAVHMKGRRKGIDLRDVIKPAAESLTDMVIRMDDRIKLIEAERDRLREGNQELLAACRLAFDALDDLPTTKNGPVRMAWEAARAAIAKAETAS